MRTTADTAMQMAMVVPLALGDSSPSARASEFVPLVSRDTASLGLADGGGNGVGGGERGDGESGAGGGGVGGGGVGGGGVGGGGVGAGDVGGGGDGDGGGSGEDDGGGSGDGEGEAPHVLAGAEDEHS